MPAGSSCSRHNGEGEGMNYYLNFSRMPKKLLVMVELREYEG